jgi:hypothetical protein
MRRVLDEDLRRQGRFRDLVRRMLAPEDATWQPEANGVWQTRVVRRRRRTEPTRADLIAAVDESPAPLPAPIFDYIMTRYLKAQPRKTGPQQPTRSTWEDLDIIAHYQRALRKARKAHKRDGSPLTRAVKTRAKELTANAFSLSPRTIESIVAPRHLLKPPPK